MVGSVLGVEIPSCWVRPRKNQVKGNVAVDQAGAGDIVAAIGSGDERFGDGMFRVEFEDQTFDRDVSEALSLGPAGY